MTRKSEEYWEKHIAAWGQSGLSITAYARDNGMVQSTLSKRIKRSKQFPNAVKVKIPIETIAPKDSCITDISIESKTMRITIPSTVDSLVIQTIIRELNNVS